MNEKTHSPMTVYFDGACPICVREVNMIRGKDRESLIAFVDIAAPDFSPEAVGISYDDLMAEIHGRLDDGTLIVGVEVFRQMYSRIGFSPLVGLTRLGGVRHGLELAYKLWAKNRLRLTGRCVDGVCEVPAKQGTAA